MPSEERERRGRCIGNLELVEPVPDSGHAAMTQGETSEGKENLRHCGEGSTRRPTDGNLLQEAQGTAGSAVEELSRRRGERKAGRAQGKQQSPKPGASGSSSAPLAAADGMQEQGHLYTFRRRWVGGRPPAAALVPEPLTELLLRHNAGPSQESPAKGVPPPAQGPGGIQESPLVHTSPGRPKKLTDLPFAPGDHVVRHPSFRMEADPSLRLNAEGSRLGLSRRRCDQGVLGGLHVTILCLSWPPRCTSPGSEHRVGTGGRCHGHCCRHLCRSCHCKCIREARKSNCAAVCSRASLGWSSAW